MSEAAWLPSADWLQVVRHAPLVAIDLILEGPDGRILLGWRRNEPARDCWFVPGGAIRKGETLNAAFARIAETELGLQLQRQDAQLLGAYQHVYDSNFALEPGVGTHYVVLAHRLRLSESPVLRADPQHGELCWFGVDELMSASDVHDNVKAYFR